MFWKFRVFTSPDDPGSGGFAGAAAAGTMAPPAQNPPPQEQQAALQPRPTKARNVLFTDPEQPHKQFAAIVTDVTDEGVVHVCAFDPVMRPRNFETTGEGNAPGQWAWPPRA